MPITVELQDMFSYSPIPIIVIALIVIIPLILLLIKAIKAKKKTIKDVPKPKPVNVAHVKNKYIKMLDNIVQRRQNNKISDRDAFQELSKVIRHFVFDLTGIKVQNYTLEEIGKLNIPNLYYLIAECYVPEFAEDDKTEVYDTINKARKVIEEWY